MVSSIQNNIEFQLDEKPNGFVIRINNETGCVIRICQIPKELIFDENGEVKNHIDITYPKQINLI